jgi:hypothetical protein
MKKILKALLILIIVLILLIIFIPIIFKSDLLNIAKKQINNNVNAKVEFADFNLSMIKNFPDLTVEMKKLSVVGKAPFAGDTLMKFDRFLTSVNLISVIKGDNIKIKTIELHHPIIFAKILQDGTANWDIAKSAEEPKKEETPDQEKTDESGMPDINISLKKFEITNADIGYHDISSNMKAGIRNLNFLLQGDMSKDMTNLNLSTSIDTLNFIYGGIKYLRDATFSFMANLGADMVNNVYMLRKNEIKLNELMLALKGSVQMDKNQTITDISFKTGNTSFKTLLSLIPAIYMQDFQDIQTKGTLALNGSVKGTMSEETLPSAIVNLQVNDAMFNYPDLPEAVKDINIDLNVDFDGANQDQTEVHLKKFHLAMAGNPFDMKMDITTPMSDPQVNGAVNGRIDFEKIKNIVPMTDIKLSGLLTAKLDFGGKVSMIENEQYENFKADGSVKLDKFRYSGENVPKPVFIDRMYMDFSPRYVELMEFSSRIGQSDMRMNGRIENFIPYTFSDGILRGNFKFNSSLLDLNELMATSGEDEVMPEQTTESPDTATMSVVKVPGNINFKLTSTIGMLNYDKLEMKNVLGIIEIRNNEINLANLSMDMLEGSMIINGAYNTQNTAKPIVDFALDISGFDIATTFTSIEMIEKLVPIGKNCEGRFYSDFNFTSFLDQQMNPVMESVNGSGNFSSQNVVVKNSKVLNKMADKLNNDMFEKVELQDVNLDFKIENGKIYVEPFETKVGSAEMTFFGNQGIDQKMDFTADISLPRSELGGQANKLIEGFASTASAKGIDISPGSMIDLAANITGTFDDPKLMLKMKGAEGENIKEQVKTEVKERVKEEVEAKKEEAKEKAHEQAERILKEAEKKAAQIRAAAKKSANTIRRQADNKADRLVNEASNPIAKAAAKKTAKKIREEADNKADQIEREADQKADKVLSEAQKKADKLK